MSDIEKLIAELAARFLVERIRSGGPVNDPAYAKQCVILAKTIVAGARDE